MRAGGWRVGSRLRGRRGVILIITLWVLVILSSVALTYAYYARMDLQMTGYGADSARARYLAKAGYYRAVILLRDDKLKDMDLLDTDDLIDLNDRDRGYQYDALNEEWYSKDEDLIDVEMGQGTFHVTVTDESGRININVASQEVLRDLLIVTGVEEEKAIALSAAIVDWRDADDDPSDGGKDGFGEPISEDTYYNPDQSIRDIESMGPNYVNKNAPFDDVEELLLVFGMTPEIFYGDEGVGQFDPRKQAHADRTFSRRRGERPLLGLAPYVTVYSDNTLNINTAPAVVLEALLMSYNDSQAADIAEDIVKYRLGSDGRPGTRDDRPLRTLDGSDEDGYSLADVRSLGDEGLSVLQRTIPLGVFSDVFRIESVGNVNGVERKLSAVVRRRFTEPLYLRGRDTGERRLGTRMREEEEMDDREPVTFYILRFSEEGV